MCANVDQTGIYVGSEKILQHCFSPYFILDIPGVTLTVIISTLGLCLNKTEGSSGENKLTNHRPTGTLKIFFEDYQRHKSLTPSLKLVLLLDYFGVHQWNKLPVLFVTTHRTFSFAKT